MNEFDYIDWLRRQTLASPSVRVGPGDDCAVLEPQGGQPWLVTTDMLLEGSHFLLAQVGPRRVGRKAMAVNLSDIAAMGGRPIAAFISVALPRGPGTGQLAEELYLGLRERSDEFDTTIAGGDTNSGPGGLVVAVTLLGVPGPQGPILRTRAQPGDWILVTGPLGGSILGKHLDFTPRVREGLLLQEYAAIHAMIDVSDGLAADVGRLGRESGCCAILDAAEIPISDAARELARHDGRSPLEHALGDGEDFELAFAVSEADGRRLLATQPLPGLRLYHIGTFEEGTGLLLEVDGFRQPQAPTGYVHPFGA